jgi:hypothetical protein
MVPRQAASVKAPRRRPGGRPVGQQPRQLLRVGQEGMGRVAHLVDHGLMTGAEEELALGGDFRGAQPAFRVAGDHHTDQVGPGGRHRAAARRNEPAGRQAGARVRLD